MWFCRPFQLLTSISERINLIMTALDNLNTAEASVEAIVASVQQSVTTQTALLGQIHAELVAALAAGSNQDPAIQAVADKLGAQVTALGAVKDALDAATAANADPEAAAPAPSETAPQDTPPAA